MKTNTSYHPQRFLRSPSAKGVNVKSFGLTLISSAVLSVLAHAQEAPSSQGPEARDSIQEIVVTANRRAQSVIDVPYNITAVSGDEIARSGATSLDDLTRLVPGLVQTSQGPGQYGSGNNFIIRGLNAESLTGIPGGQEQTVSPVSTYLGDIPVFFPLTLNDIERVEILRGPQGTLYGSGSAGGTIRFIPKYPELDKTSGEINASVGDTEHSSQLNADIDGVLNVPIGDQLALRTVVGYKRLAGFIDQAALVRTSNGTALGIPIEAVRGDETSGFVLAPQNDTNGSHDWFVRNMLRWQASDLLRLDLTYQHQETNVQDAQTANPYWPGGSIDYSASQFPGSRGVDVLGTPGGGLFPNGASYIPPGGNYRDTKFIKNPNDRKVDVYGADLTFDLGFAKLTSSTSYFDNRVGFTTDGTRFYINVTNPSGGVPLVALYNFYPRLMVPTLEDRRNTTFTEELRLASNWNRPVDYVVGAYYSDAHTHDILNQYNPGIEDYSAATTQFDPNPQYGDLNWHTDRHTIFSDKALFGEVTWHITPRWQLTGGSRLFWQTFSNDYIQHLYICGAACGDGLSPNQNLGTSAISEERSFHNHISKINTSFDITGSTKVYFTYSEGFRHGGANTVPTAGYFASFPKYLTFNPDLAKNYELGLKGTIDRRMTYTVALFNINWTNFQFEGLTPSALPAVFNGGTARSRGVELEATAQITERFRISVGYSYTDAHLTRSFNIVDYPQYGFVNGAAPVVGTSGPDGASLPGAPRNSGTLMADYVVPLPGDDMWSLDLNANASYRGASESAFPSSAIFPATIPSATIVNARAALRFRERWSVDLSVQNIGNALGLSTGTPVNHASPFNDGVIAQPRTVILGVHLHM